MLKKGVPSREIEQNEEREQGHIEKQLLIRIAETKEDWKNAKDSFQKERQRISKLAEKEGAKNRIKKSLKRIDRNNNTQFTRGREKHEKKVQFLIKKYRKPENMEQKVKCWISSVAEGKEGPLSHPPIPVYGNLSFDEDEKAILRLPPDFPTLGKVSKQNCQYESALTRAKIRLTRRTEGSPAEQEQEAEELLQETGAPSVDPTPEQVILDQGSREIYDPDTLTYNLGKLKATDVRNNPKIYLPKPRPYREEQVLESKEQVYLDTWMAYQNEHCNAKGDQLETNLTNSEERGKDKLLKRVELGEIIISETDKSQNFTVSTPDSYIEQGNKHVAKDRKISWGQYKAINNEVMQHTRAFVNIFQPAMEWGENEETRVRETYAGIITKVATMTCHQKHHKPTDQSGNPQSEVFRLVK